MNVLLSATHSQLLTKKTTYVTIETHFFVYADCRAGGTGLDDGVGRRLSSVVCRIVEGLSLFVCTYNDFILSY